MGYGQDKLIQLIIDAFKKSNGEENLWQYGDLLYRMKNYDYMDEYEKIAKETKYASARQMVVALIGESKKEAEIPFLISLLEDEEIEGHVIWALSNYRKSEVYEIMQKYIDHPRKCNCHINGTVIHISEGSDYLGHIVISDEVKPDSKEAIADLKALGIAKTVMLTGDRREIAEAVGRELQK